MTVYDRDTVLYLARLARADHARPGVRCGVCLAEAGADPADANVPDPNGCAAGQRLDRTIARLAAMEPSGGVDPRVKAAIETALRTA